MKHQFAMVIRYALAAAVLLSVTGCVSHNTDTSAQSQQAKDEKTRQDVANATAKLKEQSRVAAKNLDEAAHQAQHEAQVALQGAKEGWNRKNTSRVNVNAASKEQLETLPGLSARQSEEVIKGRPYSSPHDLVDRGIISEDEYNHIAGRLTTQ